MSHACGSKGEYELPLVSLCAKNHQNQDGILGMDLSPTSASICKPRVSPEWSKTAECYTIGWAFWPSAFYCLAWNIHPCNQIGSFPGFDSVYQPHFHLDILAFGIFPPPRALMCIKALDQSPEQLENHTKSAIALLFTALALTLWVQLKSRSSLYWALYGRRGFLYPCTWEWWQLTRMIVMQRKRCFGPTIHSLRPITQSGHRCPHPCHCAPCISGWTARWLLRRPSTQGCVSLAQMDVHFDALILSAQHPWIIYHIISANQVSRQITPDV